MSSLATSTANRFKAVVNSWVGPVINRGLNNDAFKASMNLEKCRRALKDMDLKGIFPDWNLVNEPLCVPVGIYDRLVGKFSFNMYPGSTQYACEDDKTNELLQTILEQTKFVEMIDDIVQESCWMDFCAVRMVCPEETNIWSVEVIQREYTKITRDPLNLQSLLNIEFTYPRTDPKGRVFWYKEKWDKDFYYEWEPIEAKWGQEKKPEDFPETPKKTEPNTYGQIPVRIVYHVYNCKDFAKGVIDKKAILGAKASIRLLNKRHFSHLEHMKPKTVIINAKIDGSLDAGAGATWQFTSGGSEQTPEVKYLEMPEIPESVKKELYDYVVDLYDSAQMTPPAYEEFFQTGQGDSAKAIRYLDQNEEKTITTLRSRGYANILRCMEDMLKMGAVIGVPGYESINPDDIKTYRVEAKFEDFYQPTVDEKVQEQAFIQDSILPPDVKAQKIAILHGIDDPEIVKQMEEHATDDHLMEGEMANATLKQAQAAAKTPQTKPPQKGKSKKK